MEWYSIVLLESGNIWIRSQAEAVHLGQQHHDADLRVLNQVPLKIDHFQFDGG